MRCPSVSLKKRCLKYFDHLRTDLIFYFLIIDIDTNFLYKIKLKNKKIYFLAESKNNRFDLQIKELFPNKNFEFGVYDYISVHLFRGHNEFIVGFQKDLPGQVFCSGSGIYEI